MNKIIQKDITFDLDLTCSIFSACKVFRKFKQDYNVEHINKSWSILKPLKITASVRVSVKHDVDISKMREKQHELMMDKRGEGTQDEKDEKGEIQR